MRILESAGLNDHAQFSPDIDPHVAAEHGESIAALASVAAKGVPPRWLAALANNGLSFTRGRQDQ